MAESLSRWESDPLFSAAEIVQDSADRMESVYRMLLHEQKLIQGCPGDSKTLVSMQYHRRDLATALETTRWQLEDLERAVNLAAISDNSNARENAIFKFRQFIGAIKEQIDQVGRTVKDTTVVELNENLVPRSSEEHDANSLALFLSGGDSSGHDIHHNSGHSIMKRFLNSETESNEIIELKNEIELNPANGLNYSINNYTNGGSHYPERNSNIPAFNQGSKDSQELCGTSTNFDLEYGNSTANSYPYMSRSSGFFWHLLRKFPRLNRNGASFTKRRKDGEIADDSLSGSELNTQPSLLNIVRSEQDKLPLIGWVQSLNLGRFSNVLHIHGSLEAIHKRLQRTQYLVFCNRRMVRVTIMLVVLTTLYFIVFRTA